jgi:hypothetical protein
MAEIKSRVRPIQTAIDAVWAAIRFLMDGITFLSIRLYGIEDCSFQDVRKGCYENVKYEPRNLDTAKDLDAILAEVKELLASAHDRRAVVTDKCKTLLTLSSFLLAVIGALLPKAFDFSSLGMKIICFLALLFLLNTVVLLLVYFGIGIEMTPSVSQEDIELDSDNLKKSLINEHFKCEAATDNRTDYLVNVYMVARSYFIVAFFVIVGLFAVSYFQPGESESQKLIRQIRANPDLIKLLQGPKGDKGDKGDSGALPAPTKCEAKQETNIPSKVDVTWSGTGGKGSYARIEYQQDSKQAKWDIALSATLGGPPWSDEVTPPFHWTRYKVSASSDGITFGQSSDPSNWTFRGNHRPDQPEPKEDGTGK